jgi:DNA-directed RNA polymerase specialized sigma24 family protein
VKDLQSDGNVATAHWAADKQSAETAERTLLAHISDGDRFAMEELYRSYFGKLARFFRHLSVHADVEELINDTMIEVWQTGASMGTNTSVSVGIMRLAYSRGQQRFAGASESGPQVSRDIENTHHDSPATVDPASNQQDLFLTLAVEERAILYLVYASGYSRREIANIMDISCEWVDALLRDARYRHRAILQ